MIQHQSVQVQIKIIHINHSQRNVQQHIQEPYLFSLSSLNPDHNIPTRYNTITIDELMGDSPHQKRTVIDYGGIKRQRK